MGYWHRERNLLMGDYTDTFPLWIHPWVSGIYALEINERVARPGDKVPAMLTAYRDEFGEDLLRSVSVADHLPQQDTLPSGRDGVVIWWDCPDA